MDAPTPQPWGLGLKPRLCLNLPPSFIVFFPARDNATPSGGKNYTGLGYANLSWVGVLRAPIPFQREPAWHRVATEYFPFKDSKVSRTFMRRICYPETRPNGIYFVVSRTAEIASARHLAAWTQSTVCKIPFKKPRRLDSFSPSDSLAEFAGRPDSLAEVTCMIMKAKVDLANGLLELDRTLLREEFDFLQTQDHLLHLVLKATDRGRSRITFLEGSITDVAANFKDIGRRSPRDRISLRGIPSLPDIADKIEPLSMLELDNLQDVSSKSPTKKSPLSTAPLLDSRHMTDTVVKLMPASSPQVASSPVKSIASPSSLFVDSPSPTKITRSPPSLTPVIAHGTPSSPLVDVPALNPGPTKHFAAPSYDSSPSSLLEKSKDVSSPPQLSPTKDSHPIMQTPSKASEADDLSLTQATGKTSLGLVESIPISTPKPTKTLQPISAVDPTQLRFGPSSSSFNSPTWLSSTITSRAKQTTKAARRKSEPSVRNRIRSQVARRQTTSPRKYVFESDGLSNTATAPATTSVPQHDDTAEAQSPLQMDLDQTPKKSSEEEATATIMTPAICWDKITGRKSGDRVQGTPAHHRAVLMKGTHNIDVRQNPNIFRAPVTSSISNTTSINRLAEIAGERCDGQAKVLVTEENGRLIVRFKLPTEYAYLFPGSQDADESHFTATPSAISLSPRITFNIHEPVLSNAEDSPQLEQHDALTASDVASSSMVAEEKKKAPTTTFSPVTKLQAPFTPVNQSDSHDGSATQKSPIASGQEPKVVECDRSIQQTIYEDSPGRDYMRDFIKRTHQSRLCTETGSPIAPQAGRAILGTKSPNVESPQKCKRKAETEHQDVNTSLNKITGPKPKKIRRVDTLGSDKTSRSASTSKLPTVGVGKDNLVTKATNGYNAADNRKDEEKAEVGTGTRRSTRLRCQKSASAAKSSIPTSIKLGGRPAAGGSSGSNSTRTEEKELSNKTRKNTLKNRGNAEYPAKVLARYQEDQTPGESSEENRDPQSPAKATNNRKCVGWKTPLEAHQGEGATKSRIATIKGRNIAKAGSSGIAKPAARATIAQRQQHTAKVAATLGMSQNGTPAKPNRVTRSSTRVRA
ncbi:hypothetical protein ED733_008880 [Metarhizium rileyi]|uniref:Uncharacterized protein n=1 Tax=Metarhizium rileyi (strain RCEF 4871) TaxID=1649241 RepID=A0A5C6GM03_METRR|nr:hypothetical protein ED733_008880 [Metarhizium rileyi]